MVYSPGDLIALLILLVGVVGVAGVALYWLLLRVVCGINGHDWMEAPRVVGEVGTWYIPGRHVCLRCKKEEVR